MNVITEIDSMVQRVFSSLLLMLALCMVLASCDTAQTRRRMAAIIAEADSMNRHYVAMTSDSLLLLACRYYDRHGTPNERMRAHYLLGCAYRDMGEAPQAIESYQSAINGADTTAASCDFHTLGCIYSQMAYMYHQQLLLSNEIDAYRKASHFSTRANDTLNAIFNQKMIAGAYILLNKKDSAEIVVKQAIRQYKLFNHKKEAVETTTFLMYLYTERQDKISDLKQLIDDFEEEFHPFSKPHDFPPYMYQYFYYKGAYYEAIHHLDSAEDCYRRIPRPDMTYKEFEPMYKGLLSIYKKKHQADSIAKYAQLYCMVNDSSIALMDRETTAKMSASYKYNRILREAGQREKEAHLAKQAMLLLLIGSITILLFWLRHRERLTRKYESLKAKYDNATETYHRNLHTLRVLEASQKTVIQAIQNELTGQKDENASFREERIRLKQSLSCLYAEYESEKEKLIDENQQLRTKINELESQAVFPQRIENAKSFAEADIIRQILGYKRILNPLTAREKQELVKTTGEYYPLLLHDLEQTKDITQLGLYVGILTCLNLRSSDVATLLDLSLQQVSNIKQSINQALFNEKSARPLYNNLVKRYNIYSCS